jgi:probable F420-dependent oxidoreductase
VIDAPGRVDVGLMLPTREQVLADTVDARRLTELAGAAESAGLDSIWCGDSLLARPRLESLTLLAAVAARTERATVGTAVLLAPLRHPVLLAQQIATLDHLAEGRLILSVGAGFPMPATEAEYEAVGVPFRGRNARLVEIVEACRRLWRGEEVSYAGQHVSFASMQLQPRPARLGGPPVWLAGEGERALERAGSIYDGWLPYSPTPELYAERYARVGEAAQKAGRGTPTAAMYCTVALDDDSERATARLDGYSKAYYGVPLEGISQLQAFYGGDAGGCVEWLHRYIEAGARHVILRMGTLDGHRDELEAFADLAERVRAR